MDQLVKESLTSAQRDDLRVIAGMMIPESDEYKVPGADDAAIQGDILATLGRDTKMVAAALDHIAKLAGKPLAALDDARREAVVTEFRASGGAPCRRARPRDPAMLLPRRPRIALARHRAARTIPEGPCAARRRLVDPRSREGEGRQLAAGVAPLVARVSASDTRESRISLALMRATLESCAIAPA